MVHERFPRLIEVATVVVSLLSGLVLALTLREATAVSDRSGAALWVVDLTLGVVACVVLPWRHRRPVAVAAVVSAICVVSSVSNVAALVAVFAVGAAGSPRTAGIAAAGLWAANLAAVALDGFVGDTVVSLVTVALVIAAVTAWGMLAGARRALMASAAERARSDERARIAREMHDTLGHRVSLISLQAGALEMQTGSEAAARINATAHEAMDELRQVTGVLRRDGDTAPSAPLPELGDVPALVDRSRAAGLPVDLTLDVPGPVPAALGRDAYRIVQEALTNVHKHAGAARTRVEVSGAPGDRLRVFVRNAADHRAGPSEPGTGLIGLSERVALNGGRFQHGHRHGEFVVEAELRWA